MKALPENGPGRPPGRPLLSSAARIGRRRRLRMLEGLTELQRFGSRRKDMIRPLARARRAKKTISIALAFLFVLAFLPQPPRAVVVKAATAEDGVQVSAAVPVIAPGSAYRQTNLISDIPGLAPVLDP